MKNQMKNHLNRMSKYLSFILRHNPDAIKLKISIDGWVAVEELIEKMNNNGKTITLDQLRTIVQQDSKKRYSFTEDESRIRANQGHSIRIDLKLRPLEPPEYLYHGTAVRNIASIKKSGLLKQQRHHVHLSEDTQTAMQVGARYGQPVILTILAREMAQARHQFYRSENQVWLTDQVPCDYIRFPTLGMEIK